MNKKDSLKQLRRVGVFGGTFNPVHLGHLLMAQIVLEKLNLDRVVFVPTHKPPHKTSRDVISSKHRWQMLSLSIADNGLFMASDIELKRAGRSYTIDTLREMRHWFHPQVKIYFLVGRDAVPGLSQWKKIDELLTYVRFVVADRPGFSDSIHSTVPYRFISMPVLEISSSDIRRRIRNKKHIKYQVHPKVEKYIYANNLYEMR